MTFTKEKGIGAEAWRGKDRLHNEGRHIPSSKGGGQARRASLGKVELSMSGWVDANAL